MAAKLITYGMSPFIVCFQIKYLRHHKQCVEIGSDISDWMSILKGVPYGSILGVCLFNFIFNHIIYILGHTSPEIK